MKSTFGLIFAVATDLIFLNAASAASISQEAFDNATVQPAGPRSGANGKNFFNLEGTTAGGASFRSFGVADFNFGALGTVDSFSNVKLEMIESNAAFTAPGNISVYLTSNTASNIIQPSDASAVKYQGDANGAACVDPALPLSTVVGTFLFPTTGNVNSGQVDLIPLTLDAAASTAFLNALNSGSTIRLVITPDAATTAATYAGFSNTTYAGPTLSFDYQLVPEPSALVTGGIAAIGLFAFIRRRKVTPDVS
jgi:hypothetical protein